MFVPQFRLAMVAALLVFVLALPPRPTPAVAATPTLAAQIAIVRQGDVYLLDAATGAQTRLTSDGANLDPTWDNTGTTLLFNKVTPTAMTVWRWTAAAGEQPAYFPAFQGVVSPDGGSWADAEPTFSNAPGQQPADAAWVNERGLRGPITPVERGVRWQPLAWSPDSYSVALTRFSPPPATPLPKDSTYQPDASLWLTVGDPIHGKLRQLPMPVLPNNQAGVPDIAWFSPGGRFLTVGVGPGIPCASCRADGVPFYAVPVNGGAPIALGGGLGRGTLAWARDDSYAVVSGPYGRWDYTNKHLTLTETATGAQQQLTHDPAYADVSPAVSPDGSLIAFARGRDPGGPANGVAAVDVALVSRRIWLVRRDGAARPLDGGEDGLGDAAPAWTPDGGWVVFTRSQPGAALELWAAPVAGGPARQLAAGIGPPLSGPVAAQQPIFLASDYFAVRPDPAAQRAARLGAFGNGGPAPSDTPLPLALCGAALLGCAGCRFLRLARRRLAPRPNLGR